MKIDKKLVEIKESLNNIQTDIRYLRGKPVE